MPPPRSLFPSDDTWPVCGSNARAHALRGGADLSTALIAALIAEVGLVSILTAGSLDLLVPARLSRRGAHGGLPLRRAPSAPGRGGRAVTFLMAAGFAVVSHAPVLLQAMLLPALLGLTVFGAAFESRSRQALYRREKQLCAEVERRRRPQVEVDTEARISAALADVGRELIEGLDEPALGERLCRVSARVLDADLTCTFLYSPTGNAYRLAAANGLSDEEQDVARLVVLPRHVLGSVVERVREEPRMLEHVVGLPAGPSISYLGMPIRHGDEVIGLLIAGWRRPEAFADASCPAAIPA